MIQFNKPFVEFLFAFIVACLLSFVTYACSLYSFRYEPFFFWLAVLMNK
jgi:uncharacterized membrane-anchored protein